MKRSGSLLVALALLLAVRGAAGAPAGAAGAQASTAPAASKPAPAGTAASTPGAPSPRAATRTSKVNSVIFEIRHRVHHDFVEMRQVRLREEFRVGDSPYSARVVEFLPDFAMNLDTRKVFSRSNEPRNPAFRIIVREQGVARDTTWALLNMPPHFAKNSMLAFQVVRIDFSDRPPVSRDTTERGGNEP